MNVSAAKVCISREPEDHTIMLEDLVPTPRKLEVDTVDLAAPPAAVWNHIRHADLADSPLIRALFSLRTPCPLDSASAPPRRLGIPH